MTRDLASKKDAWLPGADSPFSCDCPAKGRGGAVPWGIGAEAVSCPGGACWGTAAQSLLFCSGSQPRLFPGSLSAPPHQHVLWPPSGSRDLEHLAALPRPIPVSVLTGWFSPPFLHGAQSIAHLLSLPLPPWPFKMFSSSTCCDREAVQQRLDGSDPKGTPNPSSRALSRLQGHSSLSCSG